MLRPEHLPSTPSAEMGCALSRGMGLAQESLRGGSVPLELATVWIPGF